MTPPALKYTQAPTFPLLHTYTNTGCSVTGPLLLPQGKETDIAAKHEVVWQTIEATKKRYLNIFTAVDIFVQFVYYGYKSGRLVPSDYPYVITGPLYQYASALQIHSAKLVSQGIPFNAPNISVNPTWRLPPAASFADIMEGLRGMIVGQLSSSSPKATAPLIASFESMFGVPAILDNQFSVYSPKIADSLFIVRAVLDAAFERNDLCNVVGYRDDLNVEYVSSRYREVRTQGPSGAMTFPFIAIIHTCTCS